MRNDAVDAMLYLPQLYKTDPEPLPEPEPWPKENPHIKPALSLSVSFEGLRRGLEKVTAAFKILTEALRPFIDTVVGAVRIIDLYPNKRVIYLATHGKGRTRKKNINRIKKWINKQGKHRK